jgi:hypothetical protein
MAHPSFPSPLLKKTALLVRAADCFAPLPPFRRRLIPSRGQVINRILPNGVPVKVLQHPDGTFWLVLGPNHVYQLVASKSGMNFFFIDKTGKRTRHLYLSNGALGSRHELGATTYVSDHGSPWQREQRRIEKLKAKYPSLQWDQILDARNGISKLMRYRPTGMWRKTYIALIVKARLGGMLKGERLQSEITAAINEHLWGKRKRRRGFIPAAFNAVLAPLNRLRHQARLRRERFETECKEGLTVGYHD